MTTTKWSKLRTAASAAFITGSLSAAVAAAEPVPVGVLKEGLWRLNPDASRTLGPRGQIMWVIKDDGKELVWGLMSHTPGSPPAFQSYAGLYGKEGSRVVGSPMTTKILSPAPGKMINSGSLEGGGTFSETCEITKQRTKLHCVGSLVTPAGVQPYVDDFDWIADMPK